MGDRSAAAKHREETTHDSDARDPLSDVSLVSRLSYETRRAGGRSDESTRGALSRSHGGATAERSIRARRSSAARNAHETLAKRSPDELRDVLVREAVGRVEAAERGYDLRERERERERER